MVLVIDDLTSHTLSRISNARLRGRRADSTLQIEEFFDHTVDLARPNPICPAIVGSNVFNAFGG
jgi:hypothetical protein